MCKGVQGGVQARVATCKHMMFCMLQVVMVSYGKGGEMAPQESWCAGAGLVGVDKGRWQDGAVMRVAYWG